MAVQWSSPLEGFKIIQEVRCCNISQLHAINLSSIFANFIRSRCPKPLGPPVSTPLPRRVSMKLRISNICPILVLSYIVPRGSRASAPFSTIRAASGISAVTIKSPASHLFVISSSAISAPCPTWIKWIKGELGSRNH